MTDPLPPFVFDNSFARLPEVFYERWRPTHVPHPTLIAFNHTLAEELGLQVDENDASALAAIFAGNTLPAGAEPLAQAYAGHQFGHFVPQLGDGRALLLGEVVDRHGRRRDIQLKGAGPTPFSRRGDGRAALGPVMREYIVSEAMHALDIPTTRSLAAVTTGEPVYRETALPGAVLTRVAASHLRIGTFQYFATRGDDAPVRTLADYAIQRHYPEVGAAENPYAALLGCVIEAQARLVASWMQVGFLHGVMNTDNMAISGETIDYGPCAFMDYYDPMMVFSSIDRNGRYAFGNQPPIALWNLARLAEALLTLLDPNTERAIARAEALLDGFLPRFHFHWLAGMRQKLGLMNAEAEDLTLIEALLEKMHQGQADYTLAFRLLAEVAEGEDAPFRQLFAGQVEVEDWLLRYRARLQRQTQPPSACAQAMRRANPLFIPRNHRIEQAIQAAVTQQDFTPMRRLMTVLAHPFEAQEAFADYALPPRASERVTQTFCGT